jgi:hypothetical protein
VSPSSERAVSVDNPRAMIKANADWRADNQSLIAKASGSDNVAAGSWACAPYERHILAWHVQLDGGGS